MTASPCARLFAGVLMTSAVSVPQLMAQAQEGQQSRWSVVMVTTIKPDMRAEYEAYQKQVTAAYKKAEVPSRVVLETVLGNLAEYVAITPMGKFAEFDGPGPLERGIGKLQSEALRRKGSAFMVSMQRLLSRDLPDLSIMTESSEPRPFAMVTSMRLAPGRAADFTAWVKNDYLPAAKKAEVKNLWISQAVHGGSPDERIIVMPLKSMADLDAGPILTRALGAEAAAKVSAKMAGVIESRSYSVMRYRPDLSYQLGRPAK